MMKTFTVGWTDKQKSIDISFIRKCVLFTEMINDKLWTIFEACFYDLKSNHNEYILWLDQMSLRPEVYSTNKLPCYEEIWLNVINKKNVGI
jgi:hypothetical protein